MTATAEPPRTTTAGAPAAAALSPGEGVELLGSVHGSGYKEGAALVRRGDGQMVQLGPFMYAVLEAADGKRDTHELTQAVSERVGRRLSDKQILRLAQKLSEQGLLAGAEHKAPPRRNPLLALRWKVLVTKPKLTKRITAPFTGFFRPWLMWPVVAAFIGVLWFVLIHKGVASATAQAFHSPGLLLLVFGLAVVSAGFHELGHAAACRYGGATPGGMGMGLYLVWPAFYTDVTDSYRLPKRARLRVDLGGLYFNAVVAVITMAVWLVVRVDALLLLVALQVLQMVKQLSPVIRADGYHILSDLTGVPDLYSHMGPTLRRLIPGRKKEPSALTGRARLLVTLWVLIIVPVLFSLMFSAILLLPKLATSAWDSGRHIALAMPHQASDGQIIDLLASLVRLLALALPVCGSALVAQKSVRTLTAKARKWSHGQPIRQTAVLVGTAAAVAAMVWAWWPSGQYQPVRANQGGTLASFGQLISDPQAVARPTAQPVGRVHLAPGTHLALSMIPVGGASRRHPALFVVLGAKGKPAVAIVGDSTPKLSGSGSTTGTGQPGSTTASTASPPTSGSAGSQAAKGGGTPVSATAFPFRLPAAPGPGGTQAVAVGTRAGGVTYDVAYSLVTVHGGAPVTETNSAYALADCRGCTTVAVSFQVVLVVGESHLIAPINAAGALNYNCPSCTTTAIADQLVLTLRSQPSKKLLAELNTDLRKLNALSLLGAKGTATAVAAEVAAVQQEIETQLNASGLPTNPLTPTSPSSAGSSSSPSSGNSTGSSGSSSSGAGSSSPTSSSAASSSSSSQTTTGAQTTTTSSTSTTAPTDQSSSSTTTSATTTSASSG